MTHDTGEPTTGLPRVSVTSHEAELLSEMAADKSVLEIGTGFGFSTEALCKTAKAVVTVDPDEQVKVWVQRRVSGLPCLFIQVKRVEDAPHSLAGFDMAFIDGDHQQDAVARDISDCIARLKRGGKLVLHDATAGNVLMGCKIAGIVKDLDIIPTHYGLGVWTKP